MRPVTAGKSFRMSFSRQKEVLEMPNLIEIQKNSYQWFLEEGLKEVFEDISPIADFAGLHRTHPAFLHMTFHPCFLSWQLF